MGCGFELQTKQIIVGDVTGDGLVDSIRDDTITYPSTNFRKLLKTCWRLSTLPLVPISQVRLCNRIPLRASDAGNWLDQSFIGIRVTLEPNKDTRAKAWANLWSKEHDYVKPDLDAPHHRPHEAISRILT